MDVHIVVSGTHSLALSFPRPDPPPSLPAVKNLGVWVKHLIHNFEHVSFTPLPSISEDHTLSLAPPPQVYEVTKDEHFQLIIVDYQSADLDVEAELKASSLPRWKVIKMSGGFSRSGGLQAGINYVTVSVGGARIGCV